MSLLRWYTPYPNPVNKYVTSNHAKSRDKVPDNPNINPFQIRGFEIPSISLNDANYEITIKYEKFGSIII